MRKPVRSVLLALTTGVAILAQIRTPGSDVSGQRDQEAERSILDGSREVVRTAPTDANRYELQHVIVYIDKGLLTTEDARQFSATVERVFVATSAYLHRTFDPRVRRAAKPTFYVTDRAGISHAEATKIFLRAARVIASPAIALHESVHLLLMKHPDTPRNRTDLSPEEDARVMAGAGVWLAEGLAGHVTFELAPALNLEPDRLFVKGDRTTVDEEARQWIRDARGIRVLPFVGSHGFPEGLLADRPNVAAPFYVLGQSFATHLVRHAGLAAAVRLYEEHFDGTRSIEDDVQRITGRSLVRWRTEWLAAISA